MSPIESTFSISLSPTFLNQLDKKTLVAVTIILRPIDRFGFTPGMQDNYTLHQQNNGKQNDQLDKCQIALGKLNFCTYQ